MMIYKSVSKKLQFISGFLILLAAGIVLGVSLLYSSDTPSAVDSAETPRDRHLREFGSIQVESNDQEVVESILYFRHKLDRYMGEFMEEAVARPEVLGFDEEVKSARYPGLCKNDPLFIKGNFKCRELRLNSKMYELIKALEEFSGASRIFSSEYIELIPESPDRLDSKGP